MPANRPIGKFEINNNFPQGIDGGRVAVATVAVARADELARLGERRLDAGVRTPSPSSDWRPFDPCRESVRRANGCTWHDDCEYADRVARAFGRRAIHETSEEAAARIAAYQPCEPSR